jgi:hypothetical protein
LIDATLARAKVLSSLLYLFCHFGSSFHTLWRSCSPSKLFFEVSRLWQHVNRLPNTNAESNYEC